MKKITKKKFNDTHDKYPPSNWVRFVFNYIKSTSLDYVLIVILLVLFFLGIFQSWALFVFTGLLFIIVFSILSAVILNNIRINKIRKLLGLSKKEYHEYYDKFK